MVIMASSLQVRRVFSPWVSRLTFLPLETPVDNRRHWAECWNSVYADHEITCLFREPSMCGGRTHLNNLAAQNRIASGFERKPPGNTTPTDPRSQRIQASRRSRHVTLSAQHLSRPARMFVLPAAGVPNGLTICRFPAET